MLIQDNGILFAGFIIIRLFKDLFKPKLIHYQCYRKLNLSQYRSKNEWTNSKITNFITDADKNDRLRHNSCFCYRGTTICPLTKN